MAFTYNGNDTPDVLSLGMLSYLVVDYHLFVLIEFYEHIRTKTSITMSTTFPTWYNYYVLGVPGTTTSGAGVKDRRNTSTCRICFRGRLGERIRNSFVDKIQHPFFSRFKFCFQHSPILFVFNENFSL